MHYMTTDSILLLWKSVGRYKDIQTDLKKKKKKERKEKREGGGSTNDVLMLSECSALWFFKISSLLWLKNKRTGRNLKWIPVVVS